MCFLALSLLISGCALASLQASKQNTLNAELATISNFNTISEMTQIAFEWERSEDPKVAGYNLYRAKDGSELQKIATIKDRFSTHYVDTGLEPSTSYQYAMSTYDKDGAHSQMGSIYSIQTLPALSAVDFAQVITNLPLRAKIIWSPHEDLRVSSYVIERSKAGANNWSKIAEVKGRLSAEYIDSGLKPEESFDYRVRAKSSDGVLGEPSGAQNSTTKALPLPVTNLSASLDQPKKITLSWQAPAQDDIDHYVIYSSRSKFLPATKLGTTKETSYDDYISSNGSSRFYKVTAVDTSGLEGQKPSSSVEGATLSAPEQPYIIMSSYTNGGIDIAWNPVPRAQKYIIYKSSKLGNEAIEVNDTRYFDSNVQSSQKYEYEVSAIDEYGLESDKSKAAKVELQ